MTSSAVMPPQEPETSAMLGAMLGFLSGDQRWLVDLADAGEVLPVPALCEVPLTKPWFRGIANVRGTFYSVTDLAAFHGAGATPITAQSRLLLAGAGLRRRSHDNGGKATITNMALLMTRTFGIRSMEAMQPDTSVSPAEQPWFGATYRDAEGAHWRGLRLQDLMSAVGFLDIAA